jgi:large subunit ribosomal protein L37e
MAGTASMGSKNSGINHIPCRRCGNRSYHKKKGECSSCAYGKSARKRVFSWNKKNESA